MYNKLSEIIKKIEGNVLAIELEDQLLDKFLKNDRVNIYTINSNKNNGIFSKSKKKNTNQGKSINIKRLRKYINKKSVNYLIINIEGVLDYYKYIIKDSIYLDNNIIYIYSSNKVDKEFLIKRYKRYNVKIECTDYKNGYLLKIDNKNGKNNKFKDFLYLIYDTFYNIAEMLGNILVS